MNKDSQLSISEFIDKYNYDINPIYIDKFWENISNNEWLYADDELINWIGFNQSNGKQKYIDLIKNNFKVNDDYQIYNYDQVNKIFHISQKIYEHKKEILPFKDRILKNLHNRTLYVIIHPRCFKKSLMMIKTEKANQIRDYYVDIEEIYLNYMKYQLENKDQQIEKLQDKYTKEYNFRINHTSKNITNYLYIASTEMYYTKNIFKIGKTSNIKERMKNYSTGYLNNEKMKLFKFIQVSHSSSLERYIFEYLEPYKQEDKEMFQVDYYILDNLFNKIEKFEKHMVDNYNTIIKDEFKNLITDFDFNETIKYEKFEPNEIEELDIETTESVSNVLHEIHIDAPVNPHKMFEADAIKNLKEARLELISKFINPNAVHKYRCMSIFKHEFESTYNNAMKYKERGCKYCTKDGILDKIPIYRYNKTNLIYDKTFLDWKEIEAEYTVGQALMIKKNLRIGKWKNTCFNYIHSIIGPKNNVLDQCKELSEIETKIIEILELPNIIKKNNIYKATHEETGLVLTDLFKNKLADKMNNSDYASDVDRYKVDRYLKSGKLLQGFRITN